MPANQQQSNRARGLPDWYEPEDASPPPAANANGPLPDWYTPEEPEQSAVPTQAAPAQLPSWYAPESVTVSADRPAPSEDSPVGDFAANVGTGLARIPGAIISTPHVLAHTADWLYAKLRNMTDGGNRTGADVDQDNPLAKHTLSSEDVDNGVFKGISAIAGRDVHPYEPKSFIGRMLQAGVTGAGAGFLDPAAALGVLKGGSTLANVVEGALPRMAKTAIAADAANETANVFPDEPGLAAAAAVLAHGGAGTAGRLATTAKNVVAPLWAPASAADTAAGRVMVGVDNSRPGLANPSQPDFDHAIATTKATTDNFGQGLDDYTAGGQIRDALQSRSDTLRAQRSAAGDKAYDNFRAQPALPSAELQGLMRSPSFRKAVGAANADILDEGGEPLTDYWDFDAAGDPSLKSNAAIPPDVLGRVKSRLASASAQAPSGSAEARTASILDKRFGGFLGEKYPASADFPGYAAVAQAYTDASKPLGDFLAGPVEKTLDSQKAFGNRTYTVPQDKIPNAFLKSQALRSDFNNLIAAHDGDKAAATESLRQSLIGKVQDAINPDGTLSTDAFNRAVRPYTSALNMWFPDLAKQFKTAQSAQAALDNMRAQEGLAADVQSGALRNGDGIVTADAVNGWLTKNAKALGKTQDPSTVMRLKQIAAALPHAPTAGAEAVVEGAPAAAGFALGGAESGIFGAMFHNIPAALAGPRLARFSTAYSSAIERAFTDPAYAAELASRIAKKPVGITSAQALGRAIVEDMGKGVVAAPGATTAGGANR